VAAEMCDFALGSDTGGSVRDPASNCGIVGLKPSYGAVSRYGLIDMSMSIEGIGILSQKVEDAKYVFDIIKGQDNFDTTSKNQEKKEKKQLILGLVNVEDFCDKEIADLIKEKARETAIKNGWKIKDIALPLDIALEAYYILVYTEFFSTTRKFDGRRFGKKVEDVCGVEVLRRILGGSEISKAEYHGKYYRDALKAKAYVKKQFKKLFEEVDLIVLPTVPKTPHKIGEKISVKEMYAYDVFTIPANLGGVCGISIPCGKVKEKPVGIQIFAPQLQDDFLLEKAKEFE
jgi:aspartyl-tRNA(Asn)/glutamyl-tRNA(Gln) amidotransferase subunit A